MRRYRLALQNLLLPGLLACLVASCAPKMHVATHYEHAASKDYDVVVLRRVMSDRFADDELALFRRNLAQALRATMNFSQILETPPDSLPEQALSIDANLQKENTGGCAGYFCAPRRTAVGATIDLWDGEFRAPFDIWQNFERPGPMSLPPELAERTAAAVVRYSHGQRIEN